MERAIAVINQEKKQRTLKKMKLHTKSKNNKSKKNNRKKANIAIAILENIFLFSGAPILFS